MHRQMGQPSFAETLLSEKLGQNERLERIGKVVDWGRLRRLVAEVHSAGEGRPSYPPLMMVKVLLLEQWYNLSDPEMEEALKDRISFRRFVGLGLEDDTPDHSTISRFRSGLAELGVSERLFKELEKQLQRRGLILKKGTLMDATLVEAQVRRPSMSEGRGVKSAKDPDADWTQSHRGRRSHFGYKVHVGVDEKSGLVRRAECDAGEGVRERGGGWVGVWREAAVYADRAYESKIRRKWLKSQGIKDRIMHRSHKHQKELPHWQKRRNELIDKRRKLVEKVFGTLKRSYGYSRVRYRGLKRNAVEMWFKLMAYNMRKMVRFRARPARRPTLA